MPRSAASRVEAVLMMPVPPMNVYVQKCLYAD
jgi:hypothetical protein